MGITTTINGRIIRLDNQVDFFDCLESGVEIGQQIYYERYIAWKQKREVMLSPGGEKNDLLQFDQDSTSDSTV